MKQLLEIQSKLKAPKMQFNNFGKYNYRSCEDILEAVKPLLKEHNCILTLSDEIINNGNRYHVKATATIINEDGISVRVTGNAREEEDKKGMDGSQITGTASSYARKYALNGLFLIDDSKDSDTTNKADTENDLQNFKVSKRIIDKIASVGSQTELADVWNSNKGLQSNNEFIKLVKEKKELL